MRPRLMNASVLPIIIFFFFLLMPAKGQALQFEAGPYLQQVTQTSITIVWLTDQPASSTVEFGQKASLGNKMGAPNKSKVHEVTLTGLAPETPFFYRVNSEANSQKLQSEIYTFQTAVHQESAFAYVVIGDTRTYPKRFEKIAQLAWAERPNFVLHVGDVVSDGKNREEWIDEFLRPASILMRRVPLYVAIGNHERNAHWFYDYMSYPEPENYYAFKYGNSEFFIIDTNDDIKPESKQYQWLEQALAASTAKWKFVAHHHPPYSSDENDYGDTYKGTSVLGDLNVRKNLVPLYEKYHVDIAWVGHIHTYERSWPIKNGKVDEKDGVIYIQAGGGAAELEDFAPTRTWFAAKLLRNWQYCLVAVHDGTLVMMAYDIDGKMYDYLELKK